MKVLFAVSNESISETIIKKYQQMYKEIILSKNVYYFNAIIKELEKDKTYDRIVISEDLEPFTNNNYETIDNFIFEKLDNISDEASTTAGEDIPIILIATDRRTKSDNLLIKLFGIGVYSALLGQDRSIEEVCKLIQKPRSKKEAKVYYKIDSNDVDYKPENEADVSETEIQNILTHYKRLGRNEERYVESFDSIAAQYTDQQLRVIIKFLPLNVKAVLEENSPRYQQLMSFEKPKTSKYGQYQNKNKTKLNNNTSKALSNNGIKVESIPSGEKKLTKPVIIPSANTMKRVQKVEKIEKPEEKLVQKMEEINVPDTEETNTQEPVHEIPEMVEETKKRRGRPRKIQPEIVQVEEKPKKGRGRPRKNPVEETIVEPEEDSMLPGFEEETENPEIEEKQTSSVMKPNNNESQFEEDTILSGFDDERVEFFLSMYDKDSPEYEYGFKEHYKRYLRKKNSTPEPKNDATELAGMMTLAGALLGMENDSAIDFGTAVMNTATDRQSMLPIHYDCRVPIEYSKKYDKEEYLLEIYKKIGIQVLQEADNYYYSVILPENISIVRDDYGYCINDSNGKTLIHYYDRGPFYDRTVTVDQIYVTL